MPDKSIAEKAEKAFETFTLSTVDKKTRQDVTYYHPAKDLNDCQMSVIRRNLDSNALSSYKTRPKLSLYLSKEEMKKYGIQESGDGRTRGALDIGEVMSRITKVQQGSQLIAERTLAQLCRAELEAERLLGESTTHNSSGDASTGTSGGSAGGSGIPASGDGKVDVDALINVLVLGDPAKPLLRLGGRADQADIIREVTGFELTGGAADNVSLHDFHDLQIAFEPIWTEVFDSSIADSGRKLYRDV
jgi:hypothetical protein